MYPVHDDGREARWSHSCRGVLQLKREGRLIWKKRQKAGKDVWVPYAREFAPDLPKRPHQTILLDVKTSRQAKAHATDLFPGIEKFETIKPEQLIRRVLDISTRPHDLVLDSFLGSGTTAAVAQKMGRRWIGIEVGAHAETHCALRMRKTVEGERGGISEEVNWEGGGGFRFYRLGPPVFDAEGRITDGIAFNVLAAHVWFSEIGHAWSGKAKGPVLGVKDETAIALLYNGVLGDKRPAGGNVLTRPILSLIRAKLPKDFSAKLIVYGERSALSAATLAREGIVFKQTPYDVKARR